MRERSMDDSILHQPRHKRSLLVSLILLLTLSLIVIFKALLAYADENIPADLSTSKIITSRSEVFPGNQVSYKILVKNSGGVPADVVLTDTLSAGLTIIPDSILITEDRGSYHQEDHILTWSDTVTGSDQLEIGFSAMVSDTISVGTELSNTVEISGAGTLLTIQAPTTVVSETLILFPFIRTPIPIPNISLVNPTNTKNQWTIGWSSEIMSGIFQYEVQEDTNINFDTPQSFPFDLSTLSMNVSHSVNWNNTYFYRVRLVNGSLIGPWSNTLIVGGNYEDFFDDSNSGWTMRREDTDSVNQRTFYENGNFVHRMHSRWDSMIAGPLMAAPKPPYRIESRIQLVGKDNLQSYGLIFGGDWDGSTCPNDEFTSCFNQYYRLLVTWFGNDDELKYQLKRINFHDPGNGHARGSTLIGFSEVQVNEPSHKWQVWSIEVQPNGIIKVFVNGNQVGQTTDTVLIDQPFFGTLSATDEYTGLKAEFDWYKVTSLTP